MTCFTSIYRYCLVTQRGSAGSHVGAGCTIAACRHLRAQRTLEVQEFAYIALSARALDGGAAPGSDVH